MRMHATLAGMRILVSGFEPFGGDTVNASALAVEGLAEAWNQPGVTVRSVILPVSFTRAPEVLAAAISSESPDAVLCVGEAGGRGAVTPERWAVNERAARIPDNDGNQPHGPIDGGAPRLASGLDVAAIVEAIRAAGVAAEPSDDAGRFVCNAIFRAVLTSFNGPAGFIHVPAVRASGRPLVGAETDSGARSKAGVEDTHLQPLTVPDLVRALSAAVKTVGMDSWQTST